MTTLTYSIEEPVFQSSRVNFYSACPHLPLSSSLSPPPWLHTPPSLLISLSHYGCTHHTLSSSPSPTLWLHTPHSLLSLTHTMTAHTTSLPLSLTHTMAAHTTISPPLSHPHYSCTHNALSLTHTMAAHTTLSPPLSHPHYGYTHHALSSSLSPTLWLLTPCSIPPLSLSHSFTLSLSPSLSPKLWLHTPQSLLLSLNHTMASHTTLSSPLPSPTLRLQQGRIYSRSMYLCVYSIS